MIDAIYIWIHYLKLSCIVISFNLILLNFYRTETTVYEIVNCPVLLKEMRNYFLFLCIVCLKVKPLKYFSSPFCFEQIKIFMQSSFLIFYKVFFIVCVTPRIQEEWNFFHDSPCLVCLASSSVKWEEKLAKSDVVWPHFFNSMEMLFPHTPTRREREGVLFFTNHGMNQTCPMIITIHFQLGNNLMFVQEEYCIMVS